MTYQSKKHKEVFDKAMVKKNENNYKLIAAIYLLTADNTLWNLAKNAVKKNAVDFDAIKLNAIHPKGYTLYCAAKDIYLGRDGDDTMRETWYFEKWNFSAREANEISSI